VFSLLCYGEIKMCIKLLELRDVSYHVTVGRWQYHDDRIIAVS